MTCLCFFLSLCTFNACIRGCLIHLQHACSNFTIGVSSRNQNERVCQGKMAADDARRAKRRERAAFWELQFFTFKSWLGWSPRRDGPFV